MTLIALSENEYAPFYKTYINTVKNNVELIDLLKDSINQLITVLTDLPEEKQMYAYSEGKWTIKEIVQHLIDTERILSYRALRFSRNDATPISGFDESWYAENSNGNERSYKDLLKELKLVRKSTIMLFKSFSEEMLLFSGTANDSEITVRALGFVIAGHQLHHLNVIKERYL